MRSKIHFKLQDNNSFKIKLIDWASNHDPVIVLDTHKFLTASTVQYPHLNHDCIVALGGPLLKFRDGEVFKALKNHFATEKDWLFGYLAYDLKNETEQLQSENHDGLNFPSASFFTPDLVLLLKRDTLEVQYLKTKFNHKDIEDIYNSIVCFADQAGEESTSGKDKIEMLPRISKEQYLDDISDVIRHIKLGDVYELNYCMEFYNKNVDLSPFMTYKRLMQISPTPFSVYFSAGSIHLMSASPERFLQKIGNHLISQPIKGTIQRGVSIEEDNFFKEKLRNDPKEIAENVMIVDLVRNDLSKCATRNSVTVKELCGIYSFQQVHQMISTVGCELNPEVHFIDAIKNAFPMGSMTGAPKIRAMELIEQYEHSKRGLYSGAVGYFTPEGDFDLNVVIRSLQYNSINKYLSYSVGGAITAKSDPLKEYEECLLKAMAMTQTLD
jgi:para-aminobenzoate synthetase component I